MTDYVRFFAFFGVPFGLLLGLRPSGVFSTGEFCNGLLEGLLFAAFVAAVNVWLTRRTRRRLEAKGVTFTNMQPRQERHLQMSASPSAALDAVIRVLKKMPNTRVVAADAAAGTATAHVGMTWRSVGESMTVEVRPDGAGSRVTISSKPFLPMVWLDGGKGAENVETLLRGLSAA